jgi:hypothetical protein
MNDDMERQISAPNESNRLGPAAAPSTPSTQGNPEGSPGRTSTQHSGDRSAASASDRQASRGKGRSAARRQKRPAAGTTPEQTPGGEMERRVGRIEFAEGAFVRLRVPIAADDANPGRDVLTDVDVLSIDVDSRLRVTRSVLECKSGSGQSGEAYTLVWLAGFRQLLNLDRAALVRQTVSGRGRALARKLGLLAIDASSTVDTRERAHAWLPERFAHLDGPECVAAERRTDVQLKGLPEISTVIAGFLRYGALIAKPPALLAGVATYGRAVQRQGAVPEPAASVLGGHALIALVLAALQDASQLDSIPPRLLHDRLSRALTVGDPDDTSLLALLERADALVRHLQERTHRAYVNAGAEPIRMDVPSLRDVVATPPDYVDDYVDLVDRLRANPQVARDLLQTTELVCFDAVLAGQAWKAPAFAHLFTTEHRALMLVALRCLGRVAGDAVADSVAALRRLDFGSSSGHVPDRHERTASVQSTGPATVASDQSTGPATVAGEGGQLLLPEIGSKP